MIRTPRLGAYLASLILLLAACGQQATPDTTPPTIALNASTTELQGSVNQTLPLELTIQASDNTNLARIDLLRDETPIAQHEPTGKQATHTFTAQVTITTPGTITYQARATDAVGNIGYSNTITVTTKVVSSTPVAHDGTLDAYAGVPIEITLEADAPDGEELTYALTDLPELGTLTAFDPTDGRVTYTASPDTIGEDTFRFTASNANATSPAGTITIHIHERPTGPIASDLRVNLDEDEPVMVTLKATTDLEGELNFAILSNPSNGALADLDPVAGTLTYTPNPDFNGHDTFTYRATDGANHSPPATVTLEIHPVNDAPITQDLDIDTDEDTPVDIRVAAHDADGDPLTFDIDEPPAHGEVTGALPDITYIPDPDYFGADRIVVAISDGTEIVYAAIRITVHPVNDPPVAVIATDVISGSSPLQVAFDATGSYDIDSNSLTYAWSFGDGSSGTDSVLTHTYPDPGHYEVTLTVTDEQGASSQATLAIAVSGVIPLPDMHHIRSRHTATLLNDGRVLIVGGDTNGTAEIYDPTTNSFTITGSMANPRTQHSAVGLPNGRVLVLGGVARDFEEYDPATGQFTTVFNHAPLRVNSAFLEPDGSVLVFTNGSVNYCGGPAQVLRYQPTEKTLQVLQNFGARSDYSVTRTATGSYVLSGGVNWYLCDAGNGLTGISVLVPEVGVLVNVASMGTYRSNHDSANLPDGQVLIVGNSTAPDVFNPATRTVSVSAAAGEVRNQVKVVELQDGRVLITGRNPENTIEVYDPTTDTLEVAGEYDGERYGHTLTRLESGDILILGGRPNVTPFPQDAYLWISN